ncbi:MAG TPA: alpha/beta hydrolase domain-containing protein [Conexibacter sp.]|jgi:hypothetical protein
MIARSLVSARGALLVSLLLCAAGIASGAAAAAPSHGHHSRGAEADQPSHGHAGHGARSDVPTPKVSGPVQTVRHTDGTHGIPYTSSAIDLRTHHYTEKEYFISGTARSYAAARPLTSDGRWSVTQASTAPYKTRLLVRRPTDMSRFNGTVVVEWLNATTGRDLDVGWDFGHNEMLNSGTVYVGVSAQALPITGPQGLIAWDSERYGSLSHPGDEYSYDIFSQAAEAVADSGILGGAKVKSLIAYGDSQSASRLVTYADAIQPGARLFDALFIHSRGATGADLAPGTPTPSPTLIRPDLDANVLTLESESDVVRDGQPRYYLARQPNTQAFRDWEAAGTAHFNADEEALMRIQAFREWPYATPALQYNQCPEPMNDVHTGDLVDSALRAVDRWARGGRPPVTAPLLRVSSTPTATDYVRDALGITEGGIRLPQVVVPLGAEKGEGNTGVGTCTLAGTSAPFDAATLQRLYPTHDDYVRKLTAAVGDAVADGFVAPYDADALIEEAKDSAVPARSYVP